MTGVGVFLALILLICVNIILFYETKQDFASFTFDFNSYVRENSYIGESHKVKPRVWL